MKIGVVWVFETKTWIDLENHSMLAIEFLLLILPATFKDNLLTKYAQHTKMADDGP